MIIKLPAANVRNRIRFCLGLLLFVMLAAQINSVFFLPMIFAWVVHELGHIMAGRFFDVNIRPRVGFMGVGLNYTAETNPKKELYIALAGPAADIIFFIIFFLLKQESFAMAALVMATINLLPVLPLDGGRAVVAAAAVHTPSLKVVYALSYCGQVMAMVLSMVIINFGLRLWLMFLPLAIYFLAGRESDQAAYKLAKQVVGQQKQHT